MADVKATTQISNSKGKKIKPTVKEGSSSGKKGSKKC